MTDDHSYEPPGEGRYRPELPVPGPQFVPPPMTPPPPGTPPPGQLSTTESGAAAWRPRHALLAYVVGFVATQTTLLILGFTWAAITGAKFEELSDSGSFILIASAINSTMLMIAAWIVARMIGAVGLRDFGLTRAPFWASVGKCIAVMASYYALFAIYSSIVKLAPDASPDKLGASASDLHMIAFVLLVAVVAPVAEEFFFRGMLFRGFANSIGVFGGAVVSGVLFGALHIDSLASERLLQVVPLVVLGIALALLYSWSGTLYAPIAVHATNNALAAASYAATNDSSLGIALSAAVWILMMALCALGWRVTDRRETGLPVAYPLR